MGLAHDDTGRGDEGGQAQASASSIAALTDRVDCLAHTSSPAPREVLVGWPLLNEEARDVGAGRVWAQRLMTEYVRFGDLNFIPVHCTQMKTSGVQDGQDCARVNDSVCHFR